MSLTHTFHTAARVLRQLRHDHRTIGLILFVPSLLLVILYYVFEGNSSLFNNVAPLLLGIIPFTLMFIVTSVAVLRERISGTLERLLISRASRLDILFGYALAFGLLALIQASIASLITTEFLDITIEGSLVALLGIAVLAGVLGMAFGLLFSAFARNEFQAVQFMPAFVLPQFLTCGLFIPREQMATLLKYFSDVMPITYVVEAMQEVSQSAAWTADLSVGVAVMAGLTLLALSLGAASLKSK